MDSFVISGITFACVLAGAALGLLVRSRLPEHHLSNESRDIVKLTMGLIATMTALVLSLLIASAKSSFDTQRTGVSQLAANIIVLDRSLALYGKETQTTRELLRTAVADVLRENWPDESTKAEHSEAKTKAVKHYQELYERIVALEPKTDAQRTLQGQALKSYGDTGQLRWQLFTQREGSSIPTAFLVVMVVWMVLLLGSFALFAPRNATTLLSLIVCALAISSAVFLILELDRPFGGMIQIPSSPLRAALQQLGR
ncbi:MAG TPA: hypothetical protein VFE62_28655 [Gemmataceae bacterium]|nr:hypothetical protein [Gemmataceae bacterium]